MSHKWQRTRSHTSSVGHEMGTNASATASLMPSSPAPFSPAPSEQKDKKSKFKRQFDVANQSDEVVLGMYSDIKMHACTDGCVKRNK
jgi:hypothetical protein